MVTGEAEVQRRLASVVRLADFESLGQAAVEPGAWDYIAGGGWDEVSLREAEEAWRRRRLRPRVLVDVASVDPATTMLGQPVSMPVAIAPMAAHGLAHPDAEIASSRAAAAAGIPFTISTMATRSIEDIAATGAANRWFQLYPQVDPDHSRRLVERADAAGCSALVLTVDLPVLGYRDRDLRNGFRLPAAQGNFPEERPSHALRGREPEGYERLKELDRGITWADLDVIRSWSPLPIVLKGILTAEDARLAADAGVDAIVVSNHGGRQLDRVVATADALPEVVAAVEGRVEVWVDGGIRRGLDIVTALALGARGVLLGRPVLWALAAGGQAGVERALAILREETIVAMTLLGTPTAADITRAHVAG